MRTREKIEEELEDSAEWRDAVITIEVLLDIRDLLSEKQKN